MPEFTLSLANDRIWELEKLIEFLVNNQGKDISLIVNPEAHALKDCGIYDILDKFKFNSVTIKTSNQLELHDRYNIIYGPVDFFLTSWHKYNLEHSGKWNRQKTFGAFFGRPSGNRIAIASYLYTHYNAQSLVKLVTSPFDVNHRKLFEVDKAFYYDPNSILNFSKMIQNFDFGGESYVPTGHNLNYQAAWLRWYEDIFVEIVSEPNILGDTFYPTEKIVRCMLMKKPFIVMASRNYLDYLHQMGFYTFNEFWDEGYDGFSAADRYHSILRLIDTLSSKSLSELEDLYYSMRYQLEHNYSLIVESRYSQKIKLVS